MKIVHYIATLLFGVLLSLSPAAFAGSPSPSDSLKRIFDNPDLSDTIRARAILRYIQKDYHDSVGYLIKMLDKAQSMSEKPGAEKLTGEIIKGKVDVYRGAGDNERIQMFKSATDYLFYCQEHKDTLNEARAYFYRADAYVKFDMVDKAAEEETKAVRLFEQAKSKDEAANANYLAGYYLFNNKQYKEALSYFIVSYNEWLAEKGNLGDLGETSGWIGNTYNALKQFDSAIYYRYKSLSYFTSAKNEGGIADCYRYLGNIYQTMKNADSALALYQHSEKLFKEIGWKDRYWLVKCFIANTYFMKKEYHKAADTLDEILDTINGTKDYLSVFLAYQLGGKAYYEDGQLKKSVFAYRKYIKLNDSVQKSNDANNITEMNMKMQFEQEQQLMQIKQQQQAALDQKDKEHQLFIKNFFIGAFIVLLIFAGIMYRNFLQKKKSNIVLAKQKDEIEYQKKEIEDSINYAHNIQQAILPDIEKIASSFSGLFVLYKPKDVVSGDFYWYANIDGKVFLAAVDCTGHGVPGGFMSMIGNDKLNNIITKDGITKPGKILSELNILVKQALQQNAANSKMALRDGMDIALLCFSNKGKTAELTYSGANRPLYIVREGNLEEIKPTKVSIGGHTEDNKIFEEHTISLNKGDIIYMSSDGYADQFGGEKSKKLSTKHFKETLVSISGEPIQKQKKMLEDNLLKWQGTQEQIDDILVIGIQA